MPLRIFVAILMTLISFNIYNTINVHAENTSSFSSEVENAQELESDSTETSEQETIKQPSLGVNFQDYIPYANFINYQYQGDQNYFDVKDIIMEYAPDSNGTFQVTAFSGQETVAYVYQIRESGLYELAFFNDYYVVEDLRYSQDATNGSESLILPANLHEGTQFSSGYNKEKQLTISEIIDSYSVGGEVFNNVVKIDEEKTGESFSYYYAQIYGLLVIERTDSTGVTQKVLQLVSTQGQLN
ncbi:hypothetical protein ACF3NG_07465 [Aerococcaceae bacterium WGS1372]